MSSLGDARRRGASRGGSPGPGGYGRGGEGAHSRGRSGERGGRGRFTHGHRGDCGVRGHSRGGTLDTNHQHINLGADRNADDNLISSFQNVTIQENALPCRPDYGKDGYQVTLFTNHFHVGYGKATIYDYEISILPETRSKRITKRLLQLFMTSPEFAPYAASASHDNMKRLVSFKKIPVSSAARVFSAEVVYFDEGDGGPTGELETYYISLRLITMHDMSLMTRYLSGAVEYRSFNIQPMMSAFDILLSKHRSQHGVIVGRNKWFFPTTSLPSPLGGGLEAYRGFYSSVRPTLKKLMVNVTATTTAFYRTGNLAQLFLEFGQANSNSVRSFVHNLRVEMIHTGRKIRKTIRGVQMNTNASTYRFNCNEYGGENMSVEAYFQRKYSIALRNPQLPLIDISANRDRPMLVPPEVCTILPGQAFMGKLSAEHTAAMITISCQPPYVNAQNITGEGLSSLGLIGTNSPLAHMGLRVGSQMATVPGRILKAPTVHYNNSASPKIKNASWNLKGVRFSIGARLDNWGVLFIQDGGPDDLTSITGRQLVLGFADICSKSGMQVNKQQIPKMVDVKLPSKHQDPPFQTRPNAVKAIKGALITIRPKPKIVLVVLSNTDKAIYNGIKHLCDVQLDVLTVCVQANKFKNGQAQYNANVALKFNTKLGGLNHTIDPNDKVMTWIRAQPTMLVGSGMSHPSPGSAIGAPSIAAVVGSVDNLFGSFPAILRLQESQLDMIKDLTEMMVERLNAFKAKNNMLPQRILFFRNGVSDTKFLTVQQYELPKVRDAFLKFLTKDGKPYNPALTIIIAGKGHSTRFFSNMDEVSNNGSCKPGTVVDRGVTAIYNFDFFLQAHAGLQGTARPTHYTVLHDDNAFTADQLQGLTYGMTYLFSRATKAVSFVPPAYYAKLACERGRCYLAQFLNSFDGATSIPSDWSSHEEVVRNVQALWGNGPAGPGIRDTMFYI